MRLISKIYFVCTLAIAFGAADCHASKWRCNDSVTCRAYETYIQAKKSFENGKWKVAESLCEDAIDLVPADKSELELIGTQNIIGKGARPKIEIVEITKRKGYFPNELLKIIRLEHPPKLFIVVKLNSPQHGLAKGYQVGATDHPHLIETSVRNYGETKLKSMAVRAEFTETNFSMKFNDVDPNANKTIKRSKEFWFDGHIRLSTSERYGFGFEMMEYLVPAIEMDQVEFKH